MGFNRHLNARDTVALQYEHSRFRYPEQVGGVDTDMVAAVYSRRVSGRMSVEVSGGPQFVQLSGLSRLGPLAALMEPRSVQYSLAGSLLYHRGRNDFNVGATRGVTGGSGLLQGAETLAVNGGYSRGIGRSWHMDWNGGYSRNQTLSNALVNRELVFTGVYGGVRLSRNLGRRMGTFLSYNVQQQNSMNGTCSGPACGDRLRHVVTIGFDWHPRAIPIE